MFEAVFVQVHDGTSVAKAMAHGAAFDRQASAVWRLRGGCILRHVVTSPEECEARDHNGFYAKAGAGIIKAITGISDP
jgi:hypothetical protein